MNKLKDALEFSIKEGHISEAPLSINWESAERFSPVPFERDLEIECKANFTVRSILTRSAMENSRFDIAAMLKKDMAQHIMCTVYRPVEDKVRDLHQILMRDGYMNQEVYDALQDIYKEMRYIS